MSPRFWEDRLRDTLEAVEEIFEFTAGMDEGALAADAQNVKPKEKWNCQRCFAASSGPGL